MSFTVPSGSPPSTPDPRASRNSTFSGFGTNRSTTPAGPPPSAASFVPVGRPTTLFGNPQMDAGNTFHSRASTTRASLYSTSAELQSPSFSARPSNNILSFPAFGDDSPPRFTAVPQGNQAFQDSSPQRDFSDEEDEDYDTEEDDEDEEDSNERDEDEEEYDYSDEDVDETLEEGHSEVDPQAYVARHDLQTDERTRNLQLNVIEKPTTESDWDQGANAESILLEGLGSPDDTEDREMSQSPRRGTFPVIVKNMTAKCQPATLEEPANIIFETEDVMSYLFDKMIDVKQNDQVSLDRLYSAVAAELTSAWREENQKSKMLIDDEEPLTIGPSKKSSSFCKASFVASLLLSIHHPSPVRDPSVPRLTRFSESPLLKSLPSKLMPVPKVLLNWLNLNHNPYPHMLARLAVVRPDPTASTFYWEAIQTGILRGNIPDIIRILKDSDFTHAATAVNDGQLGGGYRGVQVGNIQKVINRAIQVLESCPAVQSGDWDVKNTDWALFRRKVENGLSDLENFQGADQTLMSPANTFATGTSFGFQNSQPKSQSFSQAVRMATSKLPEAVYVNLKIIYKILLGSPTEILSISQDWVEAVITLTAWWDGDDNDEIALKSSASFHRSLHASQQRIPRSVDANPVPAYIHRLSYAFNRVTGNKKEKGFEIDPQNEVEIGLACVFENNVESVMCLLRTWSLVVTAATAELGEVAGWFQLASGNAGHGMPPGFDESDLMVLSYGGHRDNENGIMSKDSLLLDYIDGLVRRDFIQVGEIKKEGWQFAIAVLGRIDDCQIRKDKIDEILDNIPIDSYERIDTILYHCKLLGSEETGLKIAEKFADKNIASTSAYGPILLSYARAHSLAKLKSLLSLLISLCVVSSSAFPPGSKLDPTLSALLYSPQTILSDLDNKDHEAAKLIRVYFSGYATLRRFYELRDDDNSGRLKENGSAKAQPNIGPLARKRLAARMLVNVATSAADSIHGGLYDPERESVVQVDVLLALLAESLMFLNQDVHILTTVHLHLLLKAVSDLSSSPSRIRSQCNEVVRSCLSNFHSQRAPTPHSLMKKSISDFSGFGESAASRYSLVGDEFLDRDGDGDTTMEGDSSVASTEIKEQRKWDWRRGWQREAKGDEIMATLRLGLARELAKRWLVEENYGKEKGQRKGLF